MWGLETDFQGASIRGTASATNIASALGTPLTVTGTGSQELKWFGTLRGRLGWLPTNPLLVYVTGGLAYGRVETHVAFSAVGQPGGVFGSPPASGATAGSISSTRAGWTVGGGLEWMFAPNWSIKGEYLYYDLGNITVNSTVTQAQFATVIGIYGISSTARFNGSIARAGVNYKF